LRILDQNFLYISPPPPFPCLLYVPPVP
jgi:hypothetical protein